MTALDVDRLRELAEAAERVRVSWPNERPADRAPWREFTDLPMAQTILALIVAYERAGDDAYERAARMCEANLLKVQLSTDHAINAGIKACAAAIRAMKGKA